MKIRFKRLNSMAIMPTKAHPTDAGLDITATSKCVDRDRNIVYGTGISVEIPEGHVGLLLPRSSICKKSLLLSNSVGVIDSHYRGEIMAKFKRTVDASSPYRSEYEVGDRIAQLLIIPYPEIELVEVDELTETDRGAGGYGSTGK